MKNLRFDNRVLKRLPIDPEKQNFVREVKGACFSRLKPTPVQNPSLVAISPAALSLLGLPTNTLSQIATSTNAKQSNQDAANTDLVSALSADLEKYLSGNEVLEGSEPASHCYCGHQFGSFAGQLGDGAAIYLGTIVNAKGEHWELQLKGAGMTPYSRSADGRKVLRSSLREFIGSEYMAAVGIPTTRAGSLITSDSRVARDPVYSGRVVMERCSVISRIAETFIRFGSFEICKPKDKSTSRAGPNAGKPDILMNLFTFIAEEYFPEITNSCKKEVSDAQAAEAKVKKAEAISQAVAKANGGSATEAKGGSEASASSTWQELASTRIFAEICKRTANVVSLWQAVGWCHGVLNTDNMSIIGLTIDYGPYGYMTHFDNDFVPNLSDHSGRYSFRQQPAMCQWNLQKLAEAWALIFPHQKSRFDEIIPEYFGLTYNELYQKRMAEKLGINLDEQLVTDGQQAGVNRATDTPKDAQTETSADDRKAFIEETVTELIGELMFAFQMSGAEMTNTFTLLKKLSFDEQAETDDASTRQDDGKSNSDEAIATRIAELCITPSARMKIIRRRISELTPNMHPRQIQQLLSIARVDPMKLKDIFQGNIEAGEITQFLEEENKKVQESLRLNTELMDYMGMSEETKKTKDAERWRNFISEYRKKIKALGISDDKRRAQMSKVNPVFIPFPWVLQEAISQAEDGEYSLVRNMMDRLMHPYEDDSRDNVLWQMTPPAVAEDYCVSCSS